MRKTILAALAALLVSGGNARAENFPSHPLTMVVPFSAGGPTDAMARILAERMRVTLGQNILIENVTGAAGSLGPDSSADAAVSRALAPSSHSEQMAASRSPCSQRSSDSSRVSPPLSSRRTTSASWSRAVS